MEKLCETNLLIIFYISPDARNNDVYSIPFTGYP